MEFTMLDAIVLFWGFMAGVCVTGFIYDRVIAKLEDIVYEAVEDKNYKEESV